MTDPTEDIRRAMIMFGVPESTAENQTLWTTEELQRDFVVHSFLAPFVHVTRKADGAKGTMMFTHRPRFYFSFVED